MKNYKPVFVITSCIYFIDKPLSYSSVRSQYTPKERLQQTYKTINSIRLKCPSARIILLEVGKNDELLSELKNKVDDYLYLGNHFLVRLAIDSKWKGLGEAVSLIKANKHISNKGNFFIKISGRYFLNKNINLQSWDPQKFNFFEKNQVYSTRLYGFPKNLYKEWQHTLIKSIPYLLANNSIEMVLKKFLDREKINFLQRLGVSGFASSSGGLIEE